MKLIEDEINHNLHQYEDIGKNLSTNKYKLSPIVIRQLNNISSLVNNLGLTEFNKICCGEELDDIVLNKSVQLVIDNLKKKSNTIILTILLEHVHSSKKFYSKLLKNIALFIFLNGGPSLYITLSHNLPIPHVSTIKRYLKTEFEDIREGELRVLQLSKWLEENNFPKIIWVSEDATRILEHVCECF